MTKPNLHTVWAKTGSITPPEAAKVELGWVAEIPPMEWWNWWNHRADTSINWLLENSYDKVGQFAPYNSMRIYTTGETCTTINATTGTLEIWQMYAGPNLTCANKNPQDPLNRRESWPDYPIPFWWIPYTGKAPGESVWWGGKDLPSFALQEMNQTVSAKFYWRLALARPELVVGSDINLLDAAGRFVRAADDTTYIAGQTHEDAMRRITGSFSLKENSSISAKGAFTVKQLTTPASHRNPGSGFNADVLFDVSNVVAVADQFQPVGVIENKGVAI